MENQLFEWFGWNKVANESLFSAIQSLDPLPKECIDMFSHIINTHEVWLNRICSVSDQNLGGWKGEDKKELVVRNAMLHEITKKFLSSESYGKDFNWSFIYCDTDGKRIESTLNEVYFHILTYSEHYRGQVASILKAHGVHPPRTDYFSLKDRVN